MDDYNYNENLNNVRSESNLTKYYIYELVSNLFFERAIFVIYFYIRDNNISKYD